MKLKRAEALRKGDVLALPFQRTATITEVKVGRLFVNLRIDEYPYKTRVEIGTEHMVKE